MNKQVNGMGISKEQLNELAQEEAHRTCSIYKHGAELPYHFSNYHLELFVARFMQRIKEEEDVLLPE